MSDGSTIYHITLSAKKVEVREKKIKLIKKEDFIDELERVLNSYKQELDDTKTYFVASFSGRKIKFDFLRSSIKSSFSSNLSFNEIVEQTKNKSRKIINKIGLPYIGFEGKLFKTKVKETGDVVILDIENKNKLYHLPSSYAKIIHIHYKSVNDLYYFRLHRDKYHSVLLETFFQIFGSGILRYSEILLKNIDSKFYISRGRILRKRVRFFDFNAQLKFELIPLF